VTSAGTAAWRAFDAIGGRRGRAGQASIGQCEADHRFADLVQLPLRLADASLLDLACQRHQQAADDQRQDQQPDRQFDQGDAARPRACLQGAGPRMHGQFVPGVA
jgi:hypothetical protein